jgi:hypothetical protein
VKRAPPDAVKLRVQFFYRERHFALSSALYIAPALARSKSQSQRVHANYRKVLSRRFLFARHLACPACGTSPAQRAAPRLPRHLTATPRCHHAVVAVPVMSASARGRPTTSTRTSAPATAASVSDLRDRARGRTRIRRGGVAPRPAAPVDEFRRPRHRGAGTAARAATAPHH